MTATPNYLFLSGNDNGTSETWLLCSVYFHVSNVLKKEKRKMDTRGFLQSCVLYLVTKPNSEAAVGLNDVSKVVLKSSSQN